MVIELHRQIGASMKLFLDTLGFKSIWNKVNDDFDELLVLPPETKLLKAIVNEFKRTGFIAYQFSLDFNKKGEYIKGVEQESGIKKIEFIGEVKQVKTFQNISGDFHLIRYEDEDGNNYINKRYKMDNEIVMGKVKVSCRPVVELKGFKGEKVNLINWAKAKSI